MYFQSNDKADCCGCGTCSNVCPMNAIQMVIDTHGFKYPVINKDLCVHCGICEKACIFTEKIKDTSYDCKYFAVRSKDDNVVMQSSSGGMLTLMSEEIFSRGGVVYGVAYGDGFRVEHRKAESLEAAQAFRTSKYVQSNTDELFDSVRQDLECGRTVLVTGTPCQIAGLKVFLQHSRTDTSALFTCDNICHGVSSPLTFKDYLNSLENRIPEGDRIVSINMRRKSEQGDRIKMEVCTEKNGSLSGIDEYSYYRVFQNRVANRPSCFACRFTSYSRTGDLTVADFWNASKADFSFDISHGINEVLINSKKGAELFEALKERAYYQEVTKEKAWQPHLEYAAQKPDNYGKFWEEYTSAADYAQVIRRYAKASPLIKIINFATPILRKTGLYTICGKLYKKVFVRKK